MLPSRAGDQLFHKALRGEREQVVDALAHADEPDGQAQPLLDRHHAAALGGAIELGQPVMASSTSSVSMLDSGEAFLTLRLILDSSAIRFALLCRRPAVSAMTMS